MSEKKFPWSAIDRPVAKGTINKRRFDENFSKDIWWIKDNRDQIGIQIQFGIKLNFSTTVEKFDTFQASFDNNLSHFMLTFFMINAESLEVFYGLCLDIAMCSEQFGEKSSEELLKSLFFRVKKWESLFQKSKQNFTESQQLGLLGELTLINDTLFKTFDYKKILTAWRGPIPEPQDFISANWAIEVKSQWMTSKPVVSISSLDQLDTENGDIFISHRKFKPSTETQPNNISLRDQVGLVLQKIDGDNFYTQLFLGRLHSLGFDEQAPYSEIEYVLCHSNYYQVTDCFPCLMRSLLPNSITSASYKIDFNSLGAFGLNEKQLEKILVS